MKFSNGFCVLTFLLVGCVSSPSRLSTKEDAVIIYSSTPDCKYKNLGMISASSGSVGWDVEGNENATSAELKKVAAKKGATGVILKKSEQGERQWHSSGSLHQMSGDAIKCID